MANAINQGTHPLTSSKSWLVESTRRVVATLAAVVARERKQSPHAGDVPPGVTNDLWIPPLPARAVWTPKGFVVRDDSLQTVNPNEPEGKSWILGSGLLGGSGYGGTPETAYAGGRTYE